MIYTFFLTVLSSGIFI